jgi:hypothetical protein
MDVAGDIGPDGSGTYAGVKETAATGWHNYLTGTAPTVYQSYSLVNGAFLTFHCFLKKGIRRYIDVSINNLAYVNDHAFVRIDTDTWSILETGTLDAGHPTAFVSCKLDAFGNEAELRLIAKNSSGVTHSDMGVVVAGSDADVAFAGFRVYAGNDSAIAFQVYGCTVVVSYSPWFGPGIRNGTCNALNINIDPDNIPTGDFTITGEFKLPAITTSIDYSFAWEISDGTVDNRIGLCVNQEATNSYVITNKGGTPTYVNNTGNKCDGLWHSFIVAYKAGDKTFYKLDNDSGTTVHGYTVPGLDTFTIGRQNDGSGYYLNGKIRNIKVYNKYLEKI